MIRIGDYIADWPQRFPDQIDALPWPIDRLLSRLLGELPTNGVEIADSATVESGAIIKPPCRIGPDCFVAATAYLRGGVWLDEGCIVGPSCELKTTAMFAASKVAHLSFVGDSLIGSQANIEAGAILANYRNELADKHISIDQGDLTIETGVDKFGSLVGDGARIGANAVLSPGTIIDRGEVVPRLALVDQRSV